jgi:uncharacterized ferredoxin-like protein
MLGNPGELGVQHPDQNAGGLAGNRPTSKAFSLEFAQATGIQAYVRVTSHRRALTCNIVLSLTAQPCDQCCAPTQAHPMLTNERATRTERLLLVAGEMMTAARTAPKAKGIDIIEVMLATGETIGWLSNAMLEYSEKTGMGFIARDARNILQAEAILLIGTKHQTQGLNCGYCGFASCEKKTHSPDVPCALNTVDVGIAIGSACAVAADHRVDSRVMFSVGRVALELDMIPGCSNIFGIPISGSSKNPFFDRLAAAPITQVGLAPS